MYEEKYSSQYSSLINLSYPVEDVKLFQSGQCREFIWNGLIYLFIYMLF